MLALIAQMIAGPVMATCTMQTQMTTAQAAEQQRRMSNINTNIQALTLLNSLETACLQTFQSIPTQWGSSLVVSAALNQIEQSTCQSLVNRVRSTTSAAMASAQAAVQQQINSEESGITNSTTGSAGMLSGATATSTSNSSSSIFSSLTNVISSLLK